MNGGVRTPEQKSEALAVYAEHGLAEAHRQTGIPKATLQKWARGEGMDLASIAGAHVERTKAATTARQARCEAMRSDLHERLLEAAGSLLDRLEQPYIDFRGQHADEVSFPVPPADACKHLVTAVAICIDKYRLELGEATDRTEVIAGGRNEDREERLARVVDLVELRRAS